MTVDNLLVLLSAKRRQKIFLFAPSQFIKVFKLLNKDPIPKHELISEELAYREFGFFGESF